MIRMLLYVLSIVSLVVSPITLAKSTTYGDYLVSEYHRTYDGDTFYVTINTLPPLIGENIPVRIRGVDTAEIRGKCDYEKAIAELGRYFTHTTLAGARTIKLVNVGRDKFFRINADVYADGLSIGHALLEMKLAKHYDDPNRRQWCNP